MQLTADLFLALRYLRPKRTFISVITLLSVLGPILGVALLVIVIAVMTGFDHDLKHGILGMQSHIQVFAPYGSTQNGQGVIADPAPILKRFKELGCPASPIIEGPILLQLRNKAEGKYVRGIVPESERLVTRLADSVDGRFDLREGEAMIGREMARQLGLAIGDQILIHSPANLTRNFSWKDDGTIEPTQSKDLYLPEEITIVGIFSMGVFEFDNSMVFLNLDQAADLFGLNWGSATSIHAKTPDPFHLNPVAETLRKSFPFNRILTWQEANQRMFDALRVEKNLMFFLLTFIVIVAAFGISGTLITVVVQKTREIGILKAVGMNPALVARIFLLQGAVIGLLGTGLGTLVGSLVIHFREPISAFLATVMGVEIFPAELYHFSQIPAQIQSGDVALIAGFSFVLCVLASLVPAMYASLLAPAEALREDG